MGNCGQCTRRHRASRCRRYRRQCQVYMAKIQASVSSVHGKDTGVSVKCTWQRYRRQCQVYMAKIQASVSSVHVADTGVSVKCTCRRYRRQCQVYMSGGVYGAGRDHARANGVTRRRLGGVGVEVACAAHRRWPAGTEGRRRSSPVWPRAADGREDRRVENRETGAFAGFVAGADSLVAALVPVFIGVKFDSAFTMVLTAPQCSPFRCRCPTAPSVGPVIIRAFAYMWGAGWLRVPE